MNATASAPSTSPPASAAEVPARKTRLRPVGWLLSRSLLQKLQKIVLYGFFGDRMDHRDWMVPQLFRVSRPKAPALVTDGPPAVESPRLSSVGDQLVIEHELPVAGEELWFDYIADSGDGGTATEAIARLAQHGVQLADVDVPATMAGRGLPAVLPRGQFLLVGGDTAYHVGDATTLNERFREPFNLVPGQERRPILAIPGNHDYYDALIGFNKMFRAPVEPQWAPLALRGFRSLQEASYFAMQLPFDWELWALDAPDGDLDFRQAHFFRERRRAGARKLVFITPEPAVVFGRYLAKGADTVERNLRSVGLTPGEPLKDLDARLDLAGDLHHYARHGVDSEVADRHFDRSYASVVAGGGGAFLHPTHTGAPPGTAVKGEGVPKGLQVEALSPTIEESRAECRIFPWTMGWGVFMAGALLSAAIAAAVLVSPSLRSLLDLLPGPAVRPNVPSDVSARDVPVAGWLAFGSALTLVVLPFLMTGKVGRARGRAALETEQERILRRQAFAGAWLVPVGLLAWSTMSGGVPPWFQSHFIIVAVAGCVALALWRLGLNQKFDDVVERLVMSGVPAATTHKNAQRYAIGGGATWALIGATLVYFYALSAGVPLWTVTVDFLGWLVVALLVGLVGFALGASGYTPERKRSALVLGVAHGLVHLGTALAVVKALSGVLAWSVPICVLVAAAAGAVTAPTYFACYLRTASRLSLHFNELGAAVRSEKFKHLLRFRLTADGLECFVLGIRDPGAFLDRGARAQLVDHFRVKARDS